MERNRGAGAHRPVLVAGLHGTYTLLLPLMEIHRQGGIHAVTSQFGLPVAV